ncbi:uncharacterized protein LOC132785232 [Drosophila nasuta]|uniref:uncharacterized protein LOC132785232 n=1 Tax=Drosophila nasuta TaxID=42062 RepID=UPI00295EB248|nr:uncharacterized protein LOC132785232 [Drosophila nasuta]
MGQNNTGVLELLSSIKNQDNFECLLLMKNHNASFVMDEQGNDFARSLMEAIETPVLQLDERVSYFLYSKQSNRVLSVVYMINTDLDIHRGLLKALVANLRTMTTSRVVFVVQQGEVDETFLYKLFTQCWRLKLINVLVLFEDFVLTQNFYSYNHFPRFQLEERLFEPSTIIFPQRLQNLHGYELSIIIGGSSPRIIGYYDRQGKAVYKGVVGHYMANFQQKYNCIFVEPFPANATAFAPSTDVMNAVNNGSVELSLALTFPFRLTMRGFAYPIEQMHWCLMLPVEADVPPSEYYVRVFELAAFLLTLATMVLTSLTLSIALRHHGYRVQVMDYVMHENSLRGALGQSFYEVLRAPIVVRVIYVQICVLGFLLTAWYNSYFSAYVTSSPKEAPYLNFDDVLASHLKIVAWEEEYNELVARLASLRKYAPMFYVEPDFSTYISMRDSFNTEYGYMMPTTKWVVIDAQQKTFTKPLFRMRTDFCFFQNIPFGFPVQENSIYLEPLKALILDMAATGLTSHYTQSAFMELVESGELHFTDLSPAREFRAMQLQDLQYIWYGFAFMAVLSSSVWLSELLWNWLRRRWKNIQ